MTVDDDKCLVNVFNMYKSNREIHIFVDVANENREVDNMVASKNENRETDNVETRVINAESDVGNVETDVVNVQFEVGNEETDMGDNDKENDEYGFSYEDKNWRGDDDVPYSRNDCQYVGPISTCKEWDASSDGFSDYQSGNEGGRSSSDSDNVEIMNGDSKRKRKSKVYDTFEYETEFLCNEGPTTSQTSLGSQSHSNASHTTSQINIVESTTAMEGGVKGCGRGAQSTGV
ncbi:unnamed protein product [Ilex paraguariensis]|uniref:Uncharacterized protein n=1 Tax=Ilex paraguariensis TaxID=185542 RepID=A0ABC8SKX4_9AQUA